MNEKPHVFVSYVREDKTLVDKLCSAIHGAGVEIWLDKNRIRAGERWQLAIRRAIEGGAFFIACFSDAYTKRDRSYMNVELAIALDELRRRPADRAWFIPVLLPGGSVPDRPIGGGETLRDIQWVDLPEDWNAGVARILEVLGTIELTDSARRPQFSGPPTAVLVADIVGSTGMRQQSIKETVDTLLVPAKSHRGQVADFWGDSVTLVFPSADDAVGAAGEIKGRFAKRKSQQIGIRIGIANGDIVTESTGASGAGVQLAARLCSLAEPGEVLLSESAYRAQNVATLSIRKRGLVALKGITRRLAVYELAGTTRQKSRSGLTTRSSRRRR